MITLNGQLESKSTSALGFFLDKDASGFYECHKWSAEKGLERLVFRVSKTPGYLQAHLERIYYCFQTQLDDQLFGALIDLLLVLGREGKALSRRMIAGSKSRLTEEQFQALADFMHNDRPTPQLLLFNRYSVLSKGMFSTSSLVKICEDNENKTRDPLTVARDCLQDGQLENAIHILEQAILSHPERIELHDELLPLYRITRNESNFYRIYEELSSRQISFPPEWDRLNAFFINLANE